MPIYHFSGPYISGLLVRNSPLPQIIVVVCYLLGLRICSWDGPLDSDSDIGARNGRLYRFFGRHAACLDCSRVLPIMMNEFFQHRASNSFNPLEITYHIPASCLLWLVAKGSSALSLCARRCFLRDLFVYQRERCAIPLHRLSGWPTSGQWMRCFRNFVA